jgi:hypothetical protein
MHGKKIEKKMKRKKLDWWKSKSLFFKKILIHVILLGVFWLLKNIEKLNINGQISTYTLYNIII